MYDYGHMWWGGGFLMMILWTILIIALLIWVIRMIQGRGSGPGWRTGSETPMEILKKRYARGEINKEEFDRMKKDLTDQF